MLYTSRVENWLLILKLGKIIFFYNNSFVTVKCLKTKYFKIYSDKVYKVFEQDHLISIIG